MGRSSSRRWPIASKCPPVWTQQEATRVLRQSIIAGYVCTWNGNDFPLFVWYRDDEILYEARLSNRTSGEYHGYPLEDRREWPKNFR
jgi:hypothetical protein